MVVVRRKKERGSRRAREDGDDKPADDVCGVTARYLPYIPVAGAAANGNCQFFLTGTVSVCIVNTGISASSITLFGCLFQLLDMQHSVMISPYTTIHRNMDCPFQYSAVDLQPYSGRSQDYKRGSNSRPCRSICKWACAYICRCQ